jgi:hypothetical protein
LIPDHTWLNCNADFGIIDKPWRKTDPVPSPGGWCHLIQKVRVKGSFKPMKMADFKNSDTIHKLLVTTKLTTDGKKVYHRNMTKLRF